MDEITKWCMGLFASFIVLFNVWVARSIASLKAENAAQALKMAQDYASSASITEMRHEMKTDMSELRRELQDVAKLLQRYIGETHGRRE